MSEVPVPSRSAQWWSRFPAADDALHARPAALSARIGVIAT